MGKDRLYGLIDDRADEFVDLSREIWAKPELGMHEHQSSDLLVHALESEGFLVERDIGGLPTAFVATYGDGKPVVGVLGEYDALPGLSQRVSAERDPVEAGAPGHGCGHNLYCVGSLGAAIAIKQAIVEGDVEGTVVYYGCPAEETLVGKVFMAREGVFDDLDAALAWHPMHLTFPRAGGRSLAMDSMTFRFEGASAHASAAPEAGRSALDAVQLMNTGVEYMREHVSDRVRVHYSIVDGGQQPNVVPSSGTVWYYVRAPTRGEVEQVSDWVEGIAEGAALMTRTSVESELHTGVYDYRFNDALNEVLHENMLEAPPLEYDETERAFASALRDSLDPSTVESQLSKLPASVRDRVADRTLVTEPFEPFGMVSGSADTGNVSWIAPFAMFRVATWPVGTPPHTWQATAANGDFAAKGMLYASKVLAGAIYDLFTDPSLLERARAGFDRDTDGRAYEDPLPADAEPPFHLTE